MNWRLPNWPIARGRMDVSFVNKPDMFSGDNRVVCSNCDSTAVPTSRKSTCDEKCTGGVQLGCGLIEIDNQDGKKFERITTGTRANDLVRSKKKKMPSDRRCATIRSFDQLNVISIWRSDCPK